MPQASNNQVPPGWVYPMPTPLGEGLAPEAKSDLPTVKKPSRRGRWGWIVFGVILGILGISLIFGLAQPDQLRPVDVGKYEINARGGEGNGRLICFLPPWSKSDPSYEYRLTTNLTRAEVKDNMIYIHSTVVFSIARNFGWNKGLSSDIYLKDNEGNVYPKIGAGGIYGENVPPGAFKTGIPYQGWQSFALPLNRQPFLYHSPLLRQPIQFRLKKVN